MIPNVGLMSGKSQDEWFMILYNESKTGETRLTEKRENVNYIEQTRPITEKTYDRMARRSNSPDAFQNLESWIKMLSDEYAYEVTRESRSLIVLNDKYNPNDETEIWLQMLKVQCPVCYMWFSTIAYADPTDSLEGDCPYCQAGLQY